MRAFSRNGIFGYSPGKPGSKPFYSTLLFDRVTTFLQELDPRTDQQVEALYHASMVKSGQSGYKAGKTLISLLMDSPLTILEASSSDWAIIPRNG